jgi:hypothetical protein
MLCAYYAVQINYNPEKGPTTLDLMYVTFPAFLSYLVFTPKLSTHCMHDPGSIVPHIRPKGVTDNQLSRIKYDYYYINSVTNDYDDSQQNGTAEDSITP